ncbi:hypothetical protein RIF23_18265 [Lipingzhangella sp. LS1_29]|uniref:PH domain-containing protein n=1 Tax=Lipingzhangella rawalii TaxID=2055835 RepID=A0ABU2HB72_9ACTN|nr:hypothetical protein [Lipingzhangella rawalii]MDS1272237.1 hypothetical protein [Lipingzhangella rawalii]
MPGSWQGSCTWIDLTRTRREALGCLAAAAAALLVFALAAVLGALTSGRWTAHNLAGLAAGVAGFGLLASVAVRFPRALGRQGILVQSQGLTLTEDASLWCSGRRWDLPWHALESLTSSPVDTTTHQHRAREKTLWVTIGTRGEPAAAKVPTFLWRTRSGPPQTSAPGHATVGLSLTPPQLYTLFRAVATHRPEIVNETPDVENWRSHDPAPVPSEPMPAHWFGMRAAWATLWWVCGLALVYVTITATLFEWLPRQAELARADVSAIVEISVQAATIAALLGLLVGLMPRTLAQQGVRLDGCGITLVQNRLAWRPAHSVHLPWDEIHQCRPYPRRFRGLGRTRWMLSVLITTPQRLTPAECPSWALVQPVDPHTPPATPTRPLTKVTLPLGRRHVRHLTRVLREHHPHVLPPDAAIPPSW